MSPIARKGVARLGQVGYIAKGVALSVVGGLLSYSQSAIAFATGVSPGPLGSAHPLSTPYQAFETSDGWITLGASNQKTWGQFLEVLDAPAIANDPRFADNAGRMANKPELIAALTSHFRRRSTAAWLALLEKAGVPAGPVLSVQEMHAHPQTRARAMVPVVEHATVGEVQTLGLPIKFSGTPGAIARAAPVYGQHSRELLEQAGYTLSEIDALVAEKVVAEPSPPSGAQSA